MPNKKQIFKIVPNVLPIILMIGLIPVIENDFWLTGIYLAIMIVWFLIKREKNDFLFLVFGFFVMIIAEYFFISTGVETFTRNSFLGVMPIWLPFLWAYAFVAMKRAITILNLK